MSQFWSFLHLFFLITTLNTRKAAHKLSLIFKISIKDICVLIVGSGEVEEKPYVQKRNCARLLLLVIKG